MSSVEKDQYCQEIIGELRTNFDEVSRLDNKVAKLIKEAKLFEVSEFYQYQSSRAVEFSNKVDTWNESGAKRWCLKKSQYLKTGQSIPEECQ